MSETAPAIAAVTIEEWRPDLADDATVARDVDMLADVLHAVVHGGAGVSFIVPFSLDDARAFWTGSVLPGVVARRRRVLVARSTAESSAPCSSIRPGRRTSRTAPRC